MLLQDLIPQAASIHMVKHMGNKFDEIFNAFINTFAMMYPFCPYRICLKQRSVFIYYPWKNLTELNEIRLSLSCLKAQSSLGIFNNSIHSPSYIK